ncbi:hypothetical protein Pyn_32631 [Prunus yedoensis var. nudiflora]|uniref:Pentatricopeptide repeat-containing protein n=1 Tax=Prunus yedoensis var. nudiflora TaxID=2094558 RepID=A0A314ZL89_PRUYE|nr:hypothetical protein Pyn_32631 [Prunus yedoensis var. nudiflora]
MAKRAQGLTLLQKGNPSSLFCVWARLFQKPMKHWVTSIPCWLVLAYTRKSYTDCCYQLLVRMNRVDLGFSVLATILKHGLQPNAYTLNTLLHGICKYRSLSEAMELFQKIEEKGLACSEITYATIINGLCRAGKTCMALEILEQMYEDGRFKPDPQCYNPIIDRLCKERRIDEALTLFRDMINKSVAPISSITLH